MRNNPIKPVLRKIRPNACQAMQKQVLLLPKLGQSKSKPKARYHYNKIDNDYKVQPDDRQTKQNWFSQILDSFHVWRILKFEVKKYNQIIKSWIHKHTHHKRISPWQRYQKLLNADLKAHKGRTTAFRTIGNLTQEERN